MLSAEKKKDIIKEYAINEDDTGSAPVQIALLTARIKQLTRHLKEHKQDHNSRRGLFKLVGQRKKLLDYLRNNEIETYRELIDKLGIRK